MANITFFNLMMFLTISIQVIVVYASAFYAQLSVLPWYMFWLPSILLGVLALLVIVAAVAVVYVAYKQTSLNNFKKLFEE